MPDFVAVAGKKKFHGPSVVSDLTKINTAKETGNHRRSHTSRRHVSDAFWCYLKLELASHDPPTLVGSHCFSYWWKAELAHI